MSDDIVEEDEMFTMSLNVPKSLGPKIVAGFVTRATGIIVDSTSKLMHLQKHYSLCAIIIRYNGEVYTSKIHQFQKIQDLLWYHGN